ncbi:MAG: hypothetical protein CMJ57_00870 [Planctomycetaceae bacterium]|nr:hypothetical protein [Planctomycetaceae bacterium]
MVCNFEAFDLSVCRETKDDVIFEPSFDLHTNLVGNDRDGIFDHGAGTEVDTDVLVDQCPEQHWFGDAWVSALAE